MTTRPKTTGLRYWMVRVLEESDRAAAGLSAEAVHDLRVALRRCRSMADGMMAIDPDPAWKDMKEAGKELFHSLGELRDTQIMMEWIEKLAPTVSDASTSAVNVAHTLVSSRSVSVLAAHPESNENPATTDDAGAGPQTPTESAQDPADALPAILRQREGVQKHAARAALDRFDAKQWRHWCKNLPIRAARLRVGSAVFKHLALERWMAARALHDQAMRSRSQSALHALRIGIKRFRYIIENFLPAEHKLWSDDLKRMQDLLGEIHDLDVLWATAISSHVFHGSQLRRAWHERIREERTKRINEYRQKMAGPDSLWNIWRAGLPQGKRVEQIASRRMKLWAGALDPDFAHSERVTKLALDIYDGLQAAGLLGKNPNGSGVRPSSFDERSALRIAALLHDVGKAYGNKGHHKKSQSLIESRPTPLGWDAETMQRSAVIARFHAGALPARTHKLLRDLPPDERKRIVRLAAILRLANAFDAEHDGRIRRVKVEMPPGQAQVRRLKSGRTGSEARHGSRRGRNEALAIAADGYLPASSTAQRIAGERYWLEIVLRRPIMVMSAKPAVRPITRAHREKNHPRGS